MFTKCTCSQGKKQTAHTFNIMQNMLLRSLPESLDQKCMQCPVIPEFA